MADNNNKPKFRKEFKFNLYWVYLLVGLFLVSLLFMDDKPAGQEFTYDQIEDMVKNDAVEKVVVTTNKDQASIYIKPAKIEEVFGKERAKDVVKPVVEIQIPSADRFAKDLSKWQKKDKSVKGKQVKGKEADGQSAEEGNHLTIKYEEDPEYGHIFYGIAPILIFVLIWIFMFRRMGSGGVGGGIFNVGQSQAKLFDKNTNKDKITFKDVAGLSEAKEEIQEIVHFLKNPAKYTELGGKIPKGALLVGPPGTGKTLLAKAVAGEADVPFFSLSGSDFVEMFVGVGASRVRDLFRQAKEKSPCIVFIDEIDAIGRARGKTIHSGGNDERENTLNQLLTEMDGFGSNSGVIILAATNRADILDKALLRPGRFDRQIMVDLPDVVGRREIFNVHLRNVKIDESVDIEFLAKQTPGFSGADIANVCNEAALIAARKGKNNVQKQDFLDAVDRIVGGLEKKNTIMTKSEKALTAYHEAGHATVSWMLQYANPLIKVTIVPRGRALGAAWYLPEERQHITTAHLLDDICSTLAGRAAEEIIFGEISTGALNDLENTTKKTYALIAYYGMSDKLRNISYYDSTGASEYSFSKPYSEETAKLIDKEVQLLIDEQYARAKNILLEHKDGLVELANLLIEREVIFTEDVERIFGKRPWISRADELSAEAKDKEEKEKENLTSENPEVSASTEQASETTVSQEEKDSELTTESSLDPPRTTEN
ncbi:MAG: ATP-dependent zinc metalloprotease FtsH [Paludibacteraceae bacterium]|nr:ATP-dependent zinc metalloprotease FtsH [Paludibacteraceae bacterium]